MANPRLVNGLTTLQRLERAKQLLIEEKRRVEVTVFCRLAQVSPSTIYHNYPEYAEWARAWRDGKRGRPRGRSPVAQPRTKMKDLREAEVQVDRLQRRVDELERQLEQLSRERGRLEQEVDSLRPLKGEIEKWGRLSLILFEQLRSAGVPRATIHRVWQEIEREMVVIQGDVAPSGMVR